MMNRQNHVAFLFCMLTLFLCGSVLFLVGFFPVSYDKAEEVLEDNVDASSPTTLNGVRLNVPPRKYGQTIMMVIDSLRYDFPATDTMPFAYEKACVVVKMRADIPTVTMPRIKSITTGTPSNFVDIILNLGHIEQLGDSLLHRLKKRNETITFAGDRTWVELFPRQFRRRLANNDSFFVNDFYEGDAKVSAWLLKELKLNDWTMLILHYLGLDHIGHVEGSSSSKILGKLMEMDNQVRQIYDTKHLENQILFITGDHGMRNGGGHGGSTPEELYVPLLVLEQNCTRKKNVTAKEYNQIDLTPTMAILLSLEIPSPSIGCLISELLEGLTLEEQLYAYFYNTQHLIQRAIKKYGKKAVKQTVYHKWFSDAISAHKQFLSAKRSENTFSAFSFEEAKRNYIRSSAHISTELLQSLVRFANDLIVIGLWLTSATTIYTLIFVFTESNAAKADENSKSKKVGLTIGTAVVINAWCHYMQYITTRSLLHSCLLTLPIAACVYMTADEVLFLLKLALPGQHRLSCTLTVPLPVFACFIFHTLSLGSSSFIEEEHQTWYYLGASMLIVMFVKTFQVNVRKTSATQRNVLSALQHELWQLRFSLIMLTSVALLRRLNQTGDKWRHLSDFGDVLNKKSNKVYLSLFLVVGLLLLMMRVRRFNKPMQMVGCVLAAFLIYCFHGMKGAVTFFPVEHFNTSLVLPLFWICVLGSALIRYRSVITNKSYGYERKTNVIELLETNLTTSLLIAALLHKPHNIILLPAMLFVLQEAYKLCDLLQPKPSWLSQQSYTLVHKTMLTIFVAKMFYFYQGNSNSLATIDLNPGYVGQSSYNPVIVVIFVTINTYCAHINAFFFLVQNMLYALYSRLPRRQEKEEITNELLLQYSEEDLQLVIAVYTVLTMLPVSVYLCLMLIFRYHIFIYSVFSPKVFYECSNVVLFYLNFSLANLYLKMFQ